jgi:putative membrane protein
MLILKKNHMIRYNPKQWISQIFNVAKSDTLSILWKELVILAIVTGGITYLELNYFDNIGYLTQMTAVYSLIGFVLSLLLVFRTNTAYDRWWEGRKKWGELVNNTRNIAIKMSSLPISNETKSFFRKYIPDYAFVLKEHLRNGVLSDDLEMDDAEFEKLKSAAHPPSYIASKLYKELDDLKKNGVISQEEFLALDGNLNALTDITGACERIRNTPIPYSYSLFLKKFVFIYVTTLPLAFVPTFGYGTVLIAVFIFYVLVSIEILAEEIEDPFGKDDNDLPTDELCGKIKANVEDILK